MSDFIIELKINGGDWLTAESLGLSVGTLTRRSLAPDELPISGQLATPGAALPLAYQDALSLRVNGTVVFSGECQPPRMMVTESGAAFSLSVLGPWHQLTRVLYTRSQPRTEGGSLTSLPPTLGSTFVLEGITYKWARDDNAGTTPIEVSIPRFLSTRGLLCDPDYTSGTLYRTMTMEIVSLLTYFAASYTRRGASCPITFSGAGITAALGTTATPRFRTFHDRTVGALIADLCAARPDAASWFDYSTTPPTLHLATAAAMDASTLTVGTPPLAGCDLSARPDLVPPGVMVRWEYEPATGWESRGYAHPHTVDRSPATIMPHEPGMVVHSIPWEDPLLVTPGLAASLMTASSTLRGSGSIELAGFDADLDAAAFRPGLSLTVAGLPLMAGVPLLTQDVAWDIQARAVSVSVGFPQALDLQGARDLRGWLSLTVQGWPWSYTQLVPPPAP